MVLPAEPQLLHRGRHRGERRRLPRAGVARLRRREHRHATGGDVAPLRAPPRLFLPEPRGEAHLARGGGGRAHRARRGDAVAVITLTGSTAFPLPPPPATLAGELFGTTTRRMRCRSSRA